MTTKPFAESCEQNKQAILNVLEKVLADSRHLLEFGSGTGQHAVYFGQHLPHLQWQTSDLQNNHEGIKAWLEEAALPNVLSPLALDVSDAHWPPISVDSIFSANALHIMSWRCVEHLFVGIGKILESNGLVCIYGPFNYNNAFTSESNEKFDGWLKSRDPESGIRNFENVDALARAQGLVLVEDYEMPANNRTLVWEKIT